MYVGIAGLLVGHVLPTAVRYVRRTAPPLDPETPYIDIPAPEGTVRVCNERPEVALASLEKNLRTAMSSLEKYASTVVTGRLHAYLAARALVCTADFAPRNPSNIRFAGLNPLTDEAIFDMGRGIGDGLEQVFGAILAGEDER